MKGMLKSRPIFHWTDQRIIGHLMLCFLSHFCDVQLTCQTVEGAGAGVKPEGEYSDNLFCGLVASSCFIFPLF
jgi:hypothetical protein